MTLTVPQRVFAGAIVTAVCFAAGMHFTYADDIGMVVPRIFMVLGALAVALPTFHWGAKRGFRIQDDEGRIHLGHVLRCLVMSAIMVGISGIAGAAVFMATLSFFDR